MKVFIYIKRCIPGPNKRGKNSKDLFYDERVQPRTLESIFLKSSMVVHLSDIDKSPEDPLEFCPLCDQKCLRGVPTEIF